jgi:predicted nucleic acid-binding protein
MLFDTDLLIWVFRGNQKAVEVVESADERRVSVVTYMELLQGARDKHEMKGIRSFLADSGFLVVPLSENIGHRASIYIEEFTLKFGMCMADALIAATAVENDVTLCSANRKHYKAITDLDLKLFRP